MTFQDYLEYFEWSQAEFARIIEVTPETVSRWKGDPPRIIMLYLDEIFTREQNVIKLTNWIQDHMGSKRT